MIINPGKCIVIIITNQKLIELEQQVLYLLQHSVVMKRELRQKAKLSIYPSVLVPALIDGHEQWVIDTSGWNRFSPQGGYDIPRRQAQSFRGDSEQNKAVVLT